MEKTMVSKKTALILLAILIVLLSVGISVFNVNIQVLLLLGLMITIIFILKMGHSFDDVILKMKIGIERAFPALCIFILIGGLIGTWIQAGVVPTLIYYGFKLINVKFFLPVGLIVCSITSLATGTSWGTCGTVGVAFMAMGVGLGIPAPITAGMVVSGAFFGDKMSPLSDTTNLAAITVETDLYKHIKAMLYTTIPAYILSLIGFTLIGLKYSSNSNLNISMVNEMNTSILKTFTINPLVLIPVFLVLILSIKKVNAIVALSIGVVVGVIVSILIQGNSIESALNALNIGYVSNSGVKFVDDLLTRGGIQSMMSTFSLSFIALSLGALLEAYGFLEAIISLLIGKIKRVGSLVFLVIGTSFITNIIMCEIYLSIILNGSLYKKTFKDRGLKACMLSRLVEEGGTLTGALIPWTTAGAFVSGVLGVSAFQYAPYALLNLINPILSIVFAYFGIAVLKVRLD